MALHSSFSILTYILYIINTSLVTACYSLIIDHSSFFIIYPSCLMSMLRYSLVILHSPWFIIQPSFVLLHDAFRALHYPFFTSHYAFFVAQSTSFMIHDSLFVLRYSGLFVVLHSSLFIHLDTRRTPQCARRPLGSPGASATTPDVWPPCPAPQRGRNPRNGPPNGPTPSASRQQGETRDAAPERLPRGRAPPERAHSAHDTISSDSCNPFPFHCRLGESLPDAAACQNDQTFVDNDSPSVLGLRNTARLPREASYTFRRLRRNPSSVSGRERLSLQRSKTTICPAPAVDALCRAARSRPGVSAHQLHE